LNKLYLIYLNLLDLFKLHLYVASRFLTFSNFLCEYGLSGFFKVDISTGCPKYSETVEYLGKFHIFNFSKNYIFEKNVLDRSCRVQRCIDVSSLISSYVIKLDQDYIDFLKWKPPFFLLHILVTDFENFSKS